MATSMPWARAPKGTGLYRLDDGDNDGMFEKAELIRAVGRRHG